MLLQGPWLFCGAGRHRAQDLMSSHQDLFGLSECPGGHKWVKVQSNELGHKTDKEKDLQAEKMARENEGKETVEVKT